VTVTAVSPLRNVLLVLVVGCAHAHRGYVFRDGDHDRPCERHPYEEAINKSGWVPDGRSRQQEIVYVIPGYGRTTYYRYCEATAVDRRQRDQRRVRKEQALLERMQREAEQAEQERALDERARAREEEHLAEAERREAAQRAQRIIRLAAEELVRSHGDELASAQLCGMRARLRMYRADLAYDRQVERAVSSSAGVRVANPDVYQSAELVTVWTETVSDWVHGMRVARLQVLSCTEARTELGGRLNYIMERGGDQVVAFAMSFVVARMNGEAIEPSVASPEEAQEASRQAKASYDQLYRRARPPGSEEK
jgi:hypothetical protein